jgi:hypothetical protein
MEEFERRPIFLRPMRSGRRDPCVSACCAVARLWVDLVRLEHELERYFEMHRRHLMGFCLALCVASAGCSKEKSAGVAADSPHSTEVDKTGAGHAPAEVKPGSHEDWCEEHAVPESQCTLCNPALAAAFKATGDWCPEHGLPESHCKKCNPDLQIVRPAKAN